jgi:hypothetical protein
MAVEAVHDERNLQEFADAIGVAYETLRRYRNVSASYQMRCASQIDLGQDPIQRAAPIR